MIPSFIVCTLILSSVILRYVFVSFTRLSTEIALLPETDRIFRFDPIKGIKIAGTLPIPKHLENRMLLVMFSRPGCKACHSEMDQFIKLHQRKPLPLLCVVETKHTEAYETFVAEFRNHATIIPDDGKIRMKLGVINIPSIFIVDADGVVRYVERPMTKIVDRFRKLEKTVRNR